MGEPPGGFSIFIRFVPEPQARYGHETSAGYIDEKNFLCSPFSERSIFFLCPLPLFVPSAVSCGDTYGILIRNVELAVLVPKVRAGLPSGGRGVEERGGIRE